jgi:hypothetical protein
MTTLNNQFNQPTAGQADWDASLNANFTIADRGFHVTAQAGADVRTGAVLWQNSGGFLFHFDPNSQAIWPTHLSYTAASSGDSTTVLAWGSVGSLGVFSLAIPGRPLFVSAATPGAVVGSYQGADRQIGFGALGQRVLFNPAKNFVLERLTSSLAISAVNGSLHLFEMEAGLYGWNRQTILIGNSSNLTELKFFSDSARTIRLYETVSGGVSVVGSFLDQAGWPYNSTAIGSLVYGTLKIMSLAAVGSDTISVRATWDRTR